MRVRMAASAAPRVIAGSTKCAMPPRPETGSQPSITENNQNQHRAEREIRHGKSEQREHAHGVVGGVPRRSRPQRCPRECRSRRRQASATNGKLQRRGIVRQHDLRDRLLKAERFAQISVENTADIARRIARGKRQIESERMAKLVQIFGARAFAEHLLHGIARNDVRQQENHGEISHSAGRANSSRREI